MKAGVKAGPAPPAGVLFDWDGTLVDSTAALLAAWRAATGSVLGRTFPATEGEERLLWTRGPQMLTDLTDDPAAIATMRQVFHHEYSTGARRRLTAFPGVPELLETLRRRRLRTAAVTAKARLRYDADVTRLRLAEHIDLAACADEVTAPKPDPAGINWALAATAAEVRLVGVSWGFCPAADLRAAGATSIAHTIEELREHIGTAMP
jgi:phosphoglycolate phosphatase-like HAD superfamily hydrolase